MRLGSGPRRAWSMLVLMCALSAVFTGCSDPPPPEPTEPSEPTPETEDEVTDPTPSLPVVEDAPPPLAEPPPLPEAEVLRISANGVTLVGDLRAVEGAPTAPLVVLVHQLSSQRAEWTPLLRHLAADPALATFAVDMRGHGESTEGRGGQTLAWQAFEPSDWEAVEGDLVAVLDALLERLRPARVILVGSSIGSSAVVRAAAEDERVHAVAALSPGRAYRGLDALTPLTALGSRPLLALASRQEQAAAETARDMARIAPAGRHELVDGDVHGVSMFEEDPASLAHLVAFVREQAVAQPTELAEPSEVAAEPQTGSSDD
ncbi:MAG: alpha/beta hydrolase [Sandaracinaceae bacterium]